MRSPAVLLLSHCTPEHAHDVGGKALGLGALLGFELPVPPGFVVTAGAYRTAVEAAGVGDEIAKLLLAAGTELSDAQASERIQALFTAGVLHDEAATAITSAYKELCGGGDPVLVAVRSSATAEDTAEASFAGQQDTYLGIRGVEAVMDHVVRCWASLFTPHAIAYRRRLGVPAEGLAMAVVVQRMVAAEAAGVMMTLEPVTGDRTTIYIESAFGLGEGVVRGDVGTDAFWVDKAHLTLDREEIRAKSQAHRLDAATGTVSFADVPQSEQHERSLTPAEVLALADLGRRIEVRFQRPMDIEWAIATDGSAGRRIFMLQARPETVWSNRPTGAPAHEAGEADPLETWDPLHTTSAPHLHWSRSNVGEAMPGVQTPLSWSVWSHGVENAPRYAAFTIGALTREERQVPADVNDRILQIFFGRVAMRVEFLTMLGDRMPGASGQDVAKGVFGHIPDDIAYRPTRRRYPAVAWRLPTAFALTPRRARAFAADTDTWYRTRIHGLESLALPPTLEQLREALARFEEAIALQTIVLLAVVQPLYDVLERLIAKTGVGDVATLSGTGGAEMAIVSDLWEASQGRRPLREVISAHGFHGPLEGELSSRVWREDDRPLHLLLESYAQRDNPVRAGLDHERRHQQEALVAALPAIERPAARLVLRLAEQRILLRGVIKRSFLQAFDVIRALARHAGDLLAAEGRLDAADDVFFLTVDELLGGAPADVHDLIARRRARHADYERLELPLEWRGMPVPLPAGEAPPVDGTGDMRGTGVSRGVVEGRARVLTRPDFESVEPGEILVTPTTDPSWSSIMFISAALVVDIGGALSHAAVVARELGIPCVVSTRDGTRQLRTGDRLRVDGGTGTVTILERAPV